MSLDDFTPDIESSEGAGNSAEASKEVSEKFKEAVKKASAGIGRTKKDEKKAKKYDFVLANFLVKIIVDKKYDPILERLFKTMDYGYTSNFVVGIVSLIHTDISNKIRELSNKKNISFNYYSKEEKEFDDNNLDPEVRTRINQWIEDIIDSVIIEYSNLQTKKIIELLNKDKEVIYQFTAHTFIFFLKEININISPSKAISISEFIIGEVSKSLKKIHLEDI